MKLEDLKKEIPFKWRVQSSNQYGASCVAYIDARQVQDLLDEVCGAYGWQCEYYEHKGNLFCRIGISCELANTMEWVWKSDCGTYPGSCRSHWLFPVRRKCTDPLGNDHDHLCIDSFCGNWHHLGPHLFDYDPRRLSWSGPSSCV